MKPDKTITIQPRAGRRLPYSARGIRQMKCARCKSPAMFQWNACADNNMWRPICLDCDLALNRLVLEWMNDPDWEAKSDAYEGKKRAELLR